MRRANFDFAGANASEERKANENGQGKSNNRQRNRLRSKQDGLNRTGVGEVNLMDFDERYLARILNNGPQYGSRPQIRGNFRDPNRSVSQGRGRPGTSQQLHVNHGINQLNSNRSISPRPSRPGTSQQYRTNPGINQLNYNQSVSPRRGRPGSSQQFRLNHSIDQLSGSLSNLHLTTINRSPRGSQHQRTGGRHNSNASNFSRVGARPKERREDQEDETSEIPSRQQRKRYSKCSFKKLDVLLAEDPETVMLEVVGMGNDFRDYLVSDVPPDGIVLVVHVVAIICDSKLKKNIPNVLMTFGNITFIESLQKFIQNLPYQSARDKKLNKFFWNECDAFWNNLYLVCDIFISQCPHRATEVLSKILKVIIHSFPLFESEHKQIISDDIKNQFEELQIRLVEVETKEKVKKERAQFEEPEPLEDFHTIPIFPTKEELFEDGHRTYLRSNKVQGNYSSVQQYLDIQFRLLREDFVKPLRQGINDYLNIDKLKKEGKRLSNIRVYRGVEYLAMQKVQSQIGALLQVFKKGTIQNVQYSKRLMYGSLICFTDDNFVTIHFAKVIESKPELLRVGQVIVGFGENIPLNTNKQYIMIECMVYFEPYYQTLKALKSIDIDDFPLKKYLIDVDKDIEPPNYITHQTRFRYTVDELNAVAIPVTNVNYWPEAEAMGLNESQLNAMKAALNNKFCIIQGPPGTGKTYLGLKIAKTLLQNSTSWKHSGPMLVITFKNHALDQFLEGLLEQTTSVVRIGGQSKNENLAPYNLRKLRQQEGIRNPAMREKGWDLSVLGNKLQRLTDSYKSVLDCKGIINFKEFDSLVPEEFNIKFSNVEEMQMWLMEEAEYLGGFETIEKLKQAPTEENDSDEEFYDANNVKENVVNLDDELFNTQRYSNELINLKGLQKKIFETEEKLKDMDDHHVEFNQTNCLFQKLQMYQYYLKGRLLQLQSGQLSLVPEFVSVENPFSMNFNDRWRLYATFIRYYSDSLLVQMTHLNNEYVRCYQEYEEVRDLQDIKMMRGKEVIGMTTTGAAKLQHSLQVLGCPIVIIEEAAEVLEAHVISALTSKCQHLILIGDHKQLRPSTADYYIDTHYNLGISLFERMVLNDFNCNTLNVQHRMRPEIAQLVSPAIYENLHNHPTVLRFPKVKGVDKNLFFIDHTNKETISNDSSYLNEHEVHFLLQLARYLVLNGHDPEKITILALYTGQLFKFMREKKMMPLLADVKITVLDNFQGEENEIILLSLVRNNDEKIGFLHLENRVCVALSRARKGLYVMGNMTLLCNKSEVWKKMKATFVAQDAIGADLILRCQRHENQLTPIRNIVDFDKVAEGGCTLMCNQLMNCGHNCLQICHQKPHSQYKCFQPCLKIICENKHQCPHQCYRECQKCIVPKRVTLQCGHTTNIPCYMDPEEWQCQVPIPTTLPCGHHLENKPCYIKPEEAKCRTPCDARIEPCGHACTFMCHIRKDPDHIEYECRKPCERQNAHCMDPDNEKHKCKKRCYEQCDPCSINVKKFKNCGHVYFMNCGEDVKDRICERPCMKTLDCGHKCKQKCCDPCGDCQIKVSKIIPDCYHSVDIECSKTPTRKMCFKKCEKKLACGHKCLRKCKDDCDSSTCLELISIVNRTGLCGHTLVAPCFRRNEPPSKSLLINCKEPCSTTLKCGHKCVGTCGSCIQGKVHQLCQEKCSQTWICGHDCKLPCRDMCEPCTMQCSYKCKHSSCKQSCGTPCTPCAEQCTRGCIHQSCTKRCSQLCNVPPCEEPCKKLLICGHQCIGFCGEPCPKLCRQCNEDEVTEIFFGTEDDEDSRFIYLEECNHTMESTGLEMWFKTGIKPGEITMPLCPKCKTPIFSTQRFSDYTKQFYKDVQVVKERIYGNDKKIGHSKMELIQKINQLTGKFRSKFGEKSLREAATLIDNIKKSMKKKVHQQAVRNSGTKLEILEEIWKTHDNITFRKPNIIFEIDDLAQPLIRYLTNAALMSDQLIDDIMNETKRLLRSVQLCKIKDDSESYVNFQEYQICVGKIGSFSRYTEEDDRVLKISLESLARLSRSGLNITDVEKRDILRAFNIGSGHWFKCPNGHIYLITECGGAMEIGTCNECGAKIGGQSHTLLSTNSLAREMDGAHQPAYPTINNMQMYQLD